VLSFEYSMEVNMSELERPAFRRGGDRMEEAVARACAFLDGRPPRDGGELRAHAEDAFESIGDHADQVVDDLAERERSGLRAYKIAGGLGTWLAEMASAVSDSTPALGQLPTQLTGEHDQKRSSRDHVAAALYFLAELDVELANLELRDDGDLVVCLSASAHPSRKGAWPTRWARRYALVIAALHHLRGDHHIFEPTGEVGHPGGAGRIGFRVICGRAHASVLEHPGPGAGAGEAEAIFGLAKRCKQRGRGFIQSEQEVGHRLLAVLEGERRRSPVSDAALVAGLDGSFFATYALDLGATPAEISRWVEGDEARLELGEEHPAFAESAREVLRASSPNWEQSPFGIGLASSALLFALLIGVAWSFMPSPAHLDRRDMAEPPPVADASLDNDTPRKAPRRGRAPRIPAPRGVSQLPHKITGKAEYVVSPNPQTASFFVWSEQWRRGQPMPPEWVRLEEFTNAVALEGDSPENQTFAVRCEAAPSPTDPTAVATVCTVRSRSKEDDRREPLVLTVVLDTSRSMGDEFPLVRRAVLAVFKKLRQGDRLLLTSFDEGTDQRIMHFDSRAADEASLRETLAGLAPEGRNTNGYDGLRRGYGLAEEHYSEGATNRVVLITDCAFNVGVDEPDELRRWATGPQGPDNERIGVTVLGVGYRRARAPRARARLDVYDDQMCDFVGLANGRYLHLRNDADIERVVGDLELLPFRSAALNVTATFEFDGAIVREVQVLGHDRERSRRLDEAGLLTTPDGDLGPGDMFTVAASMRLVPGEERMRQVGALRLDWIDVESGEPREQRVPFILDEERVRSSLGLRWSWLALEVASYLRGTPLDGASVAQTQNRAAQLMIDSQGTLPPNGQGLVDGIGSMQSK